jgi:hypothetical protein
MPDALTDEQIEARLRELFVENYEMLRFEGGHHLAPEVLDDALQQVLAYWRKLRHVAEKVTDTEVKLTLPNQATPGGRVFGIEGVVDIVREEGRTTLYDLKTHRADYVRANIDRYAPQLNVYAHIWQVLRGQQLSETAIISTMLPDGLPQAMRQKDEARIDAFMAGWEPLIPVPFDVVDRIEGHDFPPAPVEVLKSRQTGETSLFATSVCRNCDARFSCESYRDYSHGSRQDALRTFHNYYGTTTTDAERDEWLGAGLLSDDTKDFDSLL